MKRTPRILVLGAKGMLGQMMYRVLSTAYPKTTWGTDRTDRHFLRLEAEDAETSFKKIKQRIGKLDYVINCIGVLRQKEENDALVREYVSVNAHFPHVLAEIAKKQKFKIIHMSTDAVFSSKSKKVNEHAMPGPEDRYGMSKLLGETKHPHVLNFRSSIIGPDLHKHRGIFEWVRLQHGRVIDGYLNQQWTGCTTLQFAELCRDIIEGDYFESLRKKSSTYHFAPLSSKKYQLIKDIRVVLKDKTGVRRAKGKMIERSLTTAWKNIKPMNKFYKGTINQAISQLLV